MHLRNNGPSEQWAFGILTSHRCESPIVSMLLDLGMRERSAAEKKTTGQK